MSRLVITVGTVEFVLSPDQLSKHPDSLLSSLMNDTITKTGSEAPQRKAFQEAVGVHGFFWTICVCLWKFFAICWAKCWSSGQQQVPWLSAVEGGWRLDLGRMNIPIKSKLKVLDLASTAEFLHATYRQDFISEVFWEPLLFCRRAAIAKLFGATSTKAQYEHDSTLHADVSRVLDYFNLPGPVTRWLPPQQSLSVEHGRLLAFIHTCHTIQQVEGLVDAMLAYKPQQEQHEPTHMAAYVVCVDREVQPRLTLRVLQRVPRPALRILGRDRELTLEGILAGEPVVPMHTAIAVPLAADGSKAGDSITWSQLQVRSNTYWGTVEFAEQEGLALKSAIQARLKGTKIYLLLRSNGEVHLWVLAW